MIFMPIDTAVAAARRVSRSALPDAPVVPDDDRPGRTRRAFAALRARSVRRQRTRSAARRTQTSAC
ncbi:MAG TPA: hypothetical protein VEK80_02665 [Kribbellaceae bacterium]|nr:hypothetical protein [Kribbellaceae bacterium]